MTATATRLETQTDGTVAPLYTSEFSQAIDVNPRGSTIPYGNDH